MPKLLVVLACLACVGHGRRMKTPIEPTADIDASSPAAAFNPSGLAASQVRNPSPSVASRTIPPSMFFGAPAEKAAPKKGAKKAAPKKAAPKKAAPKRVAPKRSGAFNVLDLPGFTTSDTAALVERTDDSWVSVFDPNGLGYFDPAGFTLDATEKDIRAYREAELKHGRIAMLATLGFVVGEKFHPLFGGGLDGPSLLQPKNPELLEQIGPIGWSIFGLTIFILEGISVLTVFKPDGESWAIPSDYEAGDLFKPLGFTFDPLGLAPSDPKEFKVMQTKELNNGRLAMLAIMGMVLQEWKTGETLFA